MYLSAYENTIDTHTIQTMWLRSKNNEDFAFGMTLFAPDSRKAMQNKIRYGHAIRGAIILLDAYSNDHDATQNARFEAN